jgi:hypothetical protein
LGVEEGTIDGDASVVDARAVDSVRDAGREGAMPVDASGPVTLDDAESTPRAIAARSGELFWVNAIGGTVRTMRVDGSGLKTLASDVPSPLDIAISNSGMLFWSANTQATPLDQCLVWSAPLGSPDANCVAKDGYTPLRMALSASYVVMTVGAGAAAPLVGYWSQDAASAPALATDTTPQPAYAVAAYDSHVYFGDGNHVDTDDFDGKGLGTGTAVCNGGSACNVGDQVVDIVLDDCGGIYWAKTGMSCGSPVGYLLEAQVSPTPGAVKMLGAGFSGTPRRLAFDTKNVYVTVVAMSGSMGTILAAPISGAGRVQTVAEAGCTPFGIAADGDRVYWTCDEGMIRSAPIPR